MTASATALWLNESLGGFDHFFLKIHHFFGDKLGFLLTPLMKLISFLGEKGWVFFLLALIFMLMANKRDLGVCIFGAVCCGALITNIILKDSVARLRPFEAMEEYRLWWETVGSPAETGFSFPSGHVTACAAGMTAITLMRGRKWILRSAIIVLVMALSRNYLMAHYPTDVLAALFIGVFSGVVAWFITQLIFRFLNRQRRKIPVCGLILDFDIRDVLPFRLPALPALSALTSSVRGLLGRKGAPDRKAPAPAPDPDDDMKTYPGPDKNKAAAGKPGDEASAPKAAYTRGTAPAHAAAPARSTGKHVKQAPAPSAEENSAKRTFRFSIPGSYQGKH